MNNTITKKELFAKYKLDFNTISAYIAATYNPEVSKNLDFAAVRDSLSDGQTASKLWAIDLLSQFLHIDEKKIGVFGGWVGILPRFMFDYLGVKHVSNIEIDGTLSLVNSLVMGKHIEKFSFVHKDMYDFDYENNQFNIYVNTSGEHIPSIKEWVEKIPAGKVILIQSNDFFEHEQHVNCVKSHDELESKVAEATNVRNIIYRGTLQLPIYNRFMVVALT